MQKKKQKKGISLIVLVITIIVMIILAATIVISLTNSGIITKANEAVFATNVKNYSEELNLYLVDKLADNTNYDTKSLNADSTTTPSITDVITSMKEEDKTKFKIVAGTLFYIGDNEEELSSCEQAGVKTKYSELTEVEYNEMYKEEIARALACGEVKEDGSSKYFELTTVPSVTPIALPYGVTNIPEYSLYDIENFSDVIIPATVTNIDFSAFKSTVLCEKIVIPASVRSITKFEYYVSAKYICVSPSNKVFDSRDNCNAIINTERNTLCHGCVNTVIPQSVTSIADNAFLSTGISNIIIPYGVKSIGAYAFMYSSLKSIEIPDSVTYIGDRAFYGSSLLKNIKIPNNLEIINVGVFNGAKVETIVIPANVKKIYNDNFTDTLKNVYIEGTEITLLDEGGGNLTFSYLTSDATVYVRNETVASYLADKVGSATISTDYNWVAPTN